MSTKKINSSVAVIGGGAAGMFAACIASENSACVTLYERNDNLGRKLAITGKGRCNLTNNCDVREFLSNVPNGRKFLYSALYSFTPQDTIDYFENLGVPLKTERGNRVFPVSDRAYDIVDALKKRLKELDVKIIHSRISDICVRDGSVCGIISNGKEYKFDSVILATGGKSYPKTGSTGDGYTMAKKLGHTVTELVPSLVPLETDGNVAQSMQGLSLKNVSVKVKDKQSGKIVFEDFGEMLFTHFGVSGPIILSASSHLGKIQKDKYELHIDLKPALDEAELDKRILRDFDKYKNKDFINSLSELLPLKMIPVFAKLTGIPEHEKVNSIEKEKRHTIVKLMKDLTIGISSARPIDEAIITSGGISLDEVNPSTMESKIVKNLYFAGEILDVDAYTGGFNLQIAFSTANLAANSLISKGENI